MFSGVAFMSLCFLWRNEVKRWEIYQRGRVTLLELLNEKRQVIQRCLVDACFFKSQENEFSNCFDFFVQELKEKKLRSQL